MSAFAQSSVEIYGTLDVSFAKLSGYEAGLNTTTNSYPTTTNSSTGIANTFARQGTGTNNMGFRGKEDLGGGSYAAFNLQTGGLDQATGSAALAFSRESTLSLGGNWGELKLGRSVSTMCSIGCSFDYNYIGAGSAYGLIGLSPASNRGSSRRSGQIEFITPSMDGLSGRISLQPRAANNADNSFVTNSGTAYTATSTASGTSTTAAQYKDVVTFGGTYAQGPMRIALAVEQAHIQSSSVRNSMWFGAEYDFGFVKANLQQFTNSNVGKGTDPAGVAIDATGQTVFSTATGATTYGKGTGISLIAPVGKFNLGVQYAKNTETTVKSMELFGRYSLSKRTELYAYNTKLTGATAGVQDAAYANLAAAGAAGFPLRKSALQADPSITAIGIRTTF